MIMEKKALAALVQKYEKKAEENFRNYQETGMRRYEKAYEDASDLADSLRMAMNAADDHAELLHLKSQFSILASRARKATEPEEMEKVLKELVAYAQLRGFISKEV